MLAFALYFAVRGAAIDRPEVPDDHALAVVEAERSLSPSIRAPAGVGARASVRSPQCRGFGSVGARTRAPFGFTVSERRNGKVSYLT